MQRKKLVAFSLAALGAIGSAPSAAPLAPDADTSLLMRQQPGLQDFGPPASDEQGFAMLKKVEAKFGGVMRSMYGWTDYSFQRLFDGYKNYPVSVLQKAVDAPTYEAMMSAFDPYTTYLHQRAMAKAFPGRKAYAMNATTPGEENDPLVVQAKQSAAKVLGDATKDLVFIPITPCTTWDTRFATDPNSAGTITNGNTKFFQTFLFGTGGNFTFWGGNPSCTEANVSTAGGTPVAAMMIVYINNASANGWLTLYRYLDPDPSSATISVYYSPGPTRTQNVISKVNGGAYDVAATSRFGNTDASASVVGYFMQSPATPVDTLNQTASVVVATGTAGDVCSPTCTAGYTLTGGGCDWSAGTTGLSKTITRSGPAGTTGWCCSGTNNIGADRTLVATAFCARVPGR